MRGGRREGRREGREGRRGGREGGRGVNEAGEGQWGGVGWKLEECIDNQQGLQEV